MSCTLKHKEAINNLKSDLEIEGFKSVSISNNNDRKSIIAHNVAVNKEVEKSKKVAKKWDNVLNKLGFKGSVILEYTRPYLADNDSPTGIIRKILDLQFNEKLLNDLDDIRITLGIYESKESLVSYLKDKKSENDDDTLSDLLSNPEEFSQGIDEEIIDFFNLSDKELKNKISELLANSDSGLTEMCSI